MAVVSWKFLRRSSWGPTDWVACVISLLIAVWLILPSSAFIRPVGLSIYDGRILFTRATPLGSVYAYWGTEVQSSLGECHAPDVPSRTFYQSRSGSGIADSPGRTKHGELTVVFGIHPLLKPCIPDGGERFVVVDTHQVLIFGVIPLRAARSRWSCHADGSPCLRIE